MQSLAKTLRIGLGCLWRAFTAAGQREHHRFLALDADQYHSASVFTSVIIAPTGRSFTEKPPILAAIEAALSSH